MYKLLSILSLTLLAQFSIAGHHESGHMNKGAVIGYELSDNGEKLDIIAGDPSLVKIWVDYVEAHNQRDLEARHGFLIGTSPVSRKHDAR